MLVIGIAGGIACGKSLVALEFQSLGAEIIDADRLGHEVLQDPDVLEEIRFFWGESALTGGQVDRKAMATIVFAEDESKDLKRLETITHPRISQRIKGKISQLSSKNEVPAVVLDAPVMFKAGWDEYCDKIVFVEVPLETRYQRAMESRGWSPEALDLRERRQLSLAIKREKSSNIIDNSGTPKQTAEQVRQLWVRWGLSHSQCG